MSKHHNRMIATLWQDEEFFVGVTDQPGIRIGERGGACFDFPAHHPAKQRILDAIESNTVELVFEHLLENNSNV